MLTVPNLLQRNKKHAIVGLLPWKSLLSSSSFVKFRTTGACSRAREMKCAVLQPRGNLSEGYDRSVFRYLLMLVASTKSISVVNYCTALSTLYTI